jgi:hypothetical protein
MSSGGRCCRCPARADDDPDPEDVSEDDSEDKDDIEALNKDLGGDRPRRGMDNHQQRGCQTSKKPFNFNARR